jgi:hypothetical protein
MMLKTENLNKDLCETVIVAFADTVYQDNYSTSTEELWKQVKKVCQQYLHHSSEGLCAYKEQLLESSKIQIQPIDEKKLKWIQECHDSPVTQHQGRAKTYDLLHGSHIWNQMRKDMDHYIRNCHTCQHSKATHGKTPGLLRLLEVPEQP